MTATSAPEAEARSSLVQPVSLPADDPADDGKDASDSMSRLHWRYDADGTTASNAIKIEDDTPNDSNSELPENSTATTLRPAPQPSTKRRESEAALMSPEVIDRFSKKRKRPVSPPWQFPTAETATLKTSDGRRISARVNASTPNLSESGGRSRSVSQSVSKSRQPSPPWKKFGADGPTSIHVDGVRKSGRVNRELTEVPKRVSPRSKKQGKKFSTPQSGEGFSVQTRRRASSLRNSGLDIKTSDLPAGRHVSSQAASGSNEETERVTNPQMHAEIPRSVGRRGRRRKSSTVFTRSQLDDISSPPTRRRIHGLSDQTLSPDAIPSSTKIKLRFNAAKQVVPPPHPQAIPKSPARPPRPSLHQIIQKFEMKEMQVPYFEHDKDPPGQDFFDQRAAKQAAEEGAMRQRLLREAQSGGVLSKEKSSLYKGDKQPEPPQPYSHNDHLVAHVLYLRQLQQREKAHHRLLARKIAHEAVEYWKAIHGPTEEDLAAERTKILELIKKQVISDIDAKWRLVEAHVQEAKRAKWEAEQEVIRAERLQQKLEWSENLLARQRGEADSDIDMDEDSTGDIRDSEEEDDDTSRTEDGDDEADEIDESLDENMSGSESDTDGSGDENGDEMDEDALMGYLAQRKDGTSAAVDEYEDEASTPMQGTELAHMDDANETGTSRAFSRANTETELSESRHRSVMDGDDEQAHLSFSIDAEQSQLRTLGRRRDLSSASPTGEEVEVEKHLSSDESTDMDSEDYDSDEDMSSSEDEGGDDDDANDDSDLESHGVSQARHSLLAFYSSKDLARESGGGLPTPVTSIESGGDNDNARSASEVQSDEDRNPKEAMETTAFTTSETVEKPAQNTGKFGTASESVNDPTAAEATTEVDQTLAMSDTTGAEDATVDRGESQSASDDNATKALVSSPSLLRGTLRSYQHAGLDWLASLYRNGTNGILADEMGLGKTIQTIALLAHLAEVHEVWETHLVIVPTSVILNWVTEFQKFLPGFRVLGYYGTSEERHNKRRGWVNDPHHENKEKRGYNVIVTSYNVAMQDINAIRNVQWHYLILDEAHNIRNFNSQRWQLLIRLRTRARLLLTGTPLQNNLAEVWSLLTFLTAGDDDRSHGELEEFLGHWKDPVKEIFDKGVQTLSAQAQRVIDQLHISLRPFLLRRKKSEVEKDLPKKTESVVVCKLSKRQRQLYQDYMGLAETRATLAKGSGIQAGAVLLSLRRVCNHPDLFDPRPIQTSFAMEDSVMDCVSSKERLIRQLLGTAVDVPEQLQITANEGTRRAIVYRTRKLSASVLLHQQITQMESETIDQNPDTSTLNGIRAFWNLKRREHKVEALRARIQMTDRAIRDVPVYGSDLREMLTVHSGQPYTFSTRRPSVYRSLHTWPALGHRPLRLEHPGDWHLVQTSRLQGDIMSLDRYAERMQDLVVRFAFVPPAATAPIHNLVISPTIQDAIRSSAAYPRSVDHAHEARVRLSIAFPDSRLLIYDSGKLQRLTYLLRELQAKGSRSLIFTQMTGTLNILEQFLSLLNLPYLRLDGSTPVERRQLYSAEFNRPDSKYQCMILSSRAGGVGLNLTGASSVIFYDLDWNPQMDRQCMDRAHRIGQVRDVEVYKMVSEKTVEENILLRANQKSLLDQTVIQDGHFTTEHPTRARANGDSSNGDGDEVAAAIERFLGGGEKTATQALESVEDKEDVHAAQQARKEDHQDDDDFAERSSKGASKTTTPAPFGLEEDMNEDERKGHIDHYMIRYMEHMLQYQVYVPPPVRKVDKNGRDPGHRPKRKR